MKYLGYNYKNQLATFMSRLTLHLQKEIGFYFFDEIEINNEGLQGFSLSKIQCNTPEFRTVCKELIKDLECINLNEWDTHECLFIVCKDKNVLNSWYEQKWNSEIAMKVCKKFNFFESPVNDDEVRNYRHSIERELASKKIKE
jgi:hypothetical protein